MNARILRIVDRILFALMGPGDTDTDDVSRDIIYGI